jgi:hypothetical protein
MTNDDMLNHGEVEFERQDLSAGAILAFLVGLAIFGILMHLILAGMFKFLDAYEKRHEPPQNPLVKAVNADTRVATPQDADKFPQPRLETNERDELNDRRLKEEEILNSYGWVDPKAGIAHIPIEKAMELVAQRGLPTTPQNTAAAAKQKAQAAVNPKTRARPGGVEQKQ